MKSIARIYNLCIVIGCSNEEYYAGYCQECYWYLYEQDIIEETWELVDDSY